MPERDFSIFWFFFYFFRNFHARVEYERNSGLKVFSRFLSISHPVLAKKNARKRFFKFLNFFAIFFSEFSCPNPVWTEFGTKMFFLFFGLSYPVLAIKNAGKWFFNFFEFFSIFFTIFSPGSSMNGNRDKIFFPSLSRPMLSRFS